MKTLPYLFFVLLGFAAPLCGAEDEMIAPERQLSNTVSISPKKQAFETLKMLGHFLTGSTKRNFVDSFAKIQIAQDFKSLLKEMGEISCLPFKVSRVCLEEVFLAYGLSLPCVSPPLSKPLPFVHAPLDFVVDKETKDHVIAIYKLMEDVDEACQAFGVPYFAKAGTLLGAIRHGGFIPWDDDLDIGVTSEYAHLMPKVLKRLRRKGYKAAANRGELECLVEGAKLILTGEIRSSKANDVAGAVYKGWRVERCFNQPTVRGQKSIPFCDIFQLSRVKDRYYHTQGWPDHSYHTSELYPLKKAPFGPIEISIPQNPRVFLDKEFPEDWSRFMRKYNHGYGNASADMAHFTAPLEKMEWPKDYRPAGPFRKRSLHSAVGHSQS